MFYCLNCGGEFEKADTIYHTHSLINPPFEPQDVCPYCKSDNIKTKETKHCRCCGAKITDGEKEYCSSACKKRGEELWRREANRRIASRNSPINKILRELNEYNKENNTKYSYGQYVAIIRPTLKRKKA